jgi:fucose permease
VTAPPTVRLVRDRLTWLTYAQLAAWCYFLYGFGPVVPLLREEQGTTRLVASLHGSAFAIGAVLGGALTPWLVRRLGRSRLIWLGLAGVCAGTLGLWAAEEIWATIGCVAVASISGSFTVNAVVAVLSDHHGPAGSASISEANAAAAAVGVVAPLAVGATVTAGYGWRPGLSVVVVAVALVVAAALLLRVRTPPARPVPAPAGRRRTGSLGRGYRLAWMSLTATGAVEVCLNLWVADVLREHAGVPPGTATAAVSALVAGMFVGRLAGGRLVLRFPTARVLLASLGVSASGFAVFWLATAPGLAFAGLVLCGLGNSMHYPLGVALAVEQSGGRPDLAVSRSSYALGLSFGIAPFLLGGIADQVGPHPAFLLVPLFLVASAAVVTPLARSAAARHRDPVGDGQQHGLHPVVPGDQGVEVHDRPVRR